MGAHMNGLIGLLQEHRAGATQDLISESLRDLVASVSDENRAGSLTITISVKPIGKGDGLEVGIAHSAKMPKTVPGSAVFFATPSNDLSRRTRAKHPWSFGRSLRPASRAASPDRFTAEEHTR